MDMGQADSESIALRQHCEAELAHHLAEARLHLFDDLSSRLDPAYTSSSSSSSSSRPVAFRVTFNIAPLVDPVAGAPLVAFAMPKSVDVKLDPDLPVESLTDFVVMQLLKPWATEMKKKRVGGAYVSPSPPSSGGGGSGGGVEKVHDVEEEDDEGPSPMGRPRLLHQLSQDSQRQVQSYVAIYGSQAKADVVRQLFKVRQAHKHGEITEFNSLQLKRMLLSRGDVRRVDYELERYNFMQCNTAFYLLVFDFVVSLC